MNTFRAFLALTLDQELRDIIHTFQTKLKTCDGHLKWIEPHNTHITLKFLGDISDQQASHIEQILKEHFNDVPKITTHLDQIGTFPSHKSPRILWLGLNDEQKKIKKLAEHIDSHLAKLGFKNEQRSFKAHITLGRFKSLKNIAKIIDGINDLTIPNDSQIVLDEMVLFKSTLTNKGPIYESIYSQNLN